MDRFNKVVVNSIMLVFLLGILLIPAGFMAYMGYEEDPQVLSSQDTNISTEKYIEENIEELRIMCESIRPEEVEKSSPELTPPKIPQ